jgi:hypothetical protein
MLYFVSEQLKYFFLVSRRPLEFDDGFDVALRHVEQPPLRATAVLDLGWHVDCVHLADVELVLTL